MKVKSYKCDHCGKEMDIPVLTMTGNNQQNKYYCEDCVEQICGITAYAFGYFNKENLVKSLDINNNSNNNMPSPNWRKGCGGCNERN